MTWDDVPGSTFLPFWHGASAFWELALIARRLRRAPTWPTVPRRASTPAPLAPRSPPSRRDRERPADLRGGRGSRSSTGATPGTSLAGWQRALRLGVRAGAARRPGPDVEFWTARDAGTSRGREVARRHPRPPARRHVRLLRRGAGVVPAARGCAAGLDVVVDTEYGIPSFAPLVVGSADRGAARRAPRAPGAVPAPTSPAGLGPGPVPRGPADAAGLPATCRRSRSRSRRSPRCDASSAGADRSGSSTTAPTCRPARRRAGEPPDASVSSCSAGWSPHKRVDVVLRAVARVLADGDRAVGSTWSGQGPELPAARRSSSSELGLGDGVRLHGFLPRGREGAAARRGAAARLRLRRARAGARSCSRPRPRRPDAGPRRARAARLGPRRRDRLAASTSRTVRARRRLATALASRDRGRLDALAEPGRRSEMAGRCRDWAARFGWERMHDEARDVAVRHRAEVGGPRYLARVHKLLPDGRLGGDRHYC